ncbi:MULTISPECIES: ABC transporter ATP-binding protein [Thermoanaerobacterium]|uniref:ABC transporter n=2 Tax=Thermoanaerobacterium TaxID=28895 RepID=W9EAX6_9THEO|nr:MULTISPECIES: dipeptide/oligopeptide/nickel ABC transporter ATP-binding protein [Thermoanaerobacterium]AFK86654.1 ABC transporter related protein [Thermoanaerobacterium saccharolyticum JW/SL-YS485]ETO38331.1 ABC transporter [Thermoanaerobacterium aotearoense SCUT27]
MAKSLPLLSGRDVTKVFADKRKRVVAVDHVNFDFNSGEIISIVGESGSGKTTLAKMILGLTVPTNGKIFFKDNPIDLKTKKKRIEYWRNVQPIFQDPFSSFNIFRKVNNVLLDCIKLIGVKLKKDEEHKIIEEALSFVNLRFDEIYNKYPFELSGGQMQRLMIARVLLIKPSLVIADEPTSMIDACSRASILDALMKLRDEIGTTVVFITHDIGLAYYVSDRIYVMKEGRFVEEGLPDDVILGPKEDYTKHLIGDVPKIESKWAI